LSEVLAVLEKAAQERALQNRKNTSNLKIADKSPGIEYFYVNAYIYMYNGYMFIHICIYMYVHISEKCKQCKNCW
jgi:hypothetical protein